MTAETTDTSHETLIRSFHGSFVLEELDLNGTMCLAYRGHRDYVAEGSARDVVAFATGLARDDSWVHAVVVALERERSWKAQGSGWGRRTELELRLGRDHVYHVSACANRGSIERHGLDWRLMGAAPGVAGSKTPELPGIFLQETPDDDFFVQMARFPTDVWEVFVEDLWLESGPSGWWVVSSPIGADRLTLLPPPHLATDY